MITIKEDIPISSLCEDELGRKSLVRLVVDAIKNNMSHAHPAMTMGIYGAWGEGKTSVMQMVKSELEREKEKEKVKTIWYNPWSVADENKILMEFFSHLSNIAFNDRAISTAIENYGRLFVASDINGSYSPVAAAYFARLAQCLPTEGKNLLGIKSKISQSLRDKHEHPVIFIDDVDRLSNNEIMIVFKLLRQIADFDNVTYIVGLDPATVAVALESSYSAPDFDTVLRGRAFLEKIIQVPIILPSIDEKILQDLINGMLSEVAGDLNINVDRKSLQLVSETLSSVFTTKRSIIRYGNQLRFVLPSVYKETEFVDLCMMESLKYINERGWLEIAKQKNNLLGNVAVVASEKEMEKAKSAAYNSAIIAILSHFNSEKRVYVENVLRNHLFTKIHHYYTNPLSRSINNRIYFSQYFICGVPDGVIARDEAEEFARLVRDNQDNAISWINKNMDKYSSDEIDRTSRLTLEMFGRNDSVEMAAKLCRVLSFSDMTKGYTKSTFNNPTTIDITITAVIIPFYMIRFVNEQRVYERKVEAVVLKEMYEKAPVNFCMNIFYGVYSDSCFIPEDEKNVFDVLKSRVLEQGWKNLFEYSYFILQTFLSIWKKLYSDQYTSYINMVLNDDSFDAGAFVVHSLEANSANDQPTVIAEITNLFSDVWNLFLANLNKYKNKENRLYKLFLYNCRNIMKVSE